MAGLGELGSYGDDPEIWMARLGEVPLIDQPGARFTYGISHDILGIMLGRVVGGSFSQALGDRIFEAGHRDSFDRPAELAIRPASARG